MTVSREILEEQLESYAEQLGGLNSYIKELTDRTAELGTERAHFEEDLIEAEHNIEYYTGEIARIKKELGGATGAGTALPQTAKQGMAAFALAVISFVAGALLGSRLKSREGSKHSQRE